MRRADRQPLAGDPGLASSRAASSSVIASGTPRLSTVTSSDGPCSSEPIARASARIGCWMPFDSTIPRTGSRSGGSARRA